MYIYIYIHIYIHNVCIQCMYTMYIMEVRSFTPLGLPSHQPGGMTPSQRRSEAPRRGTNGVGTKGGRCDFHVF